MSTYTYTKAADAGRLTLEIQESTIAVALDFVSTSGASVSAHFKADLSLSEKSILDDIIDTHIATPLPDDTVPMFEIYQGKTGTGGSYQASGRKFVIPIGAAGATEVFDWSWPYPIRLFTASWIEMPAHTGATMTVEVSPDTPVGQLTGPTVVDDFWIDVPEASIPYMYIGYRLKLSNMVDTEEDLGPILEFDMDNNRVRVMTAPQAAWPAGSVILMSIVIADKLVMSGAGVPRKIGGGKVGGSLIAGGTVLRLSYTRDTENLSDIAFSIQFEIDY